ncbi:phage holin family protein [Burkholderia multivorans]|uniref:phage holin family protein n=1 Tax=Burkholderia multivorans TaxID=87883 RepID=UPI001C23C0FB|nr:phage holin family protein [Burkholderia multivorans]MBU9246588.1 phage holin family protein [Burkholderia multivorans]MCL4626512.1 phage holin family protein [Burkholderia multivorans]MCO1362271.1 phage holin family protein [Burkholderia multivorans]MCO1422042.1 phage holin family protein [Burkholderia multivorans]UQO94560.1 phage holin family protein [Burkholderia multivorans]
MLTAIYVLLCAALALRLVIFRRRGSAHRPLASCLAYALAVAAGAAPIRAAFGALPPADLADTVLVGVLCLAVYGVRGNVVELFHRGNPRDSLIARVLQFKPRGRHV